MEHLISFIKNELGFKGILFSDDLCMKALKGSFKNRARKAINAGCDIVLQMHESGELKELLANLN